MHFWGAAQGGAGGIQGPPGGQNGRSWGKDMDKVREELAFGGRGWCLPLAGVGLKSGLI